jgi:SAM-dependent methyltransferase
MKKLTDTISWDKHLPKYKIPTVLKETLLKPFFERLSLEEPIIDLGCGTGYFSEIITKTGKSVLGIDKNSDLLDLNGFTFQKKDILDFQSKTPFKTVLLINILSVESTSGRDSLIKKVHDLLEIGGKAYILTTSSKLFTSPTNSDLISFKKLTDDKVYLKVKLTSGDYLEFEDFIVQEDETRQQIKGSDLKIIKEQEFQHPDMDRPTYILYIAEK